MLFLSVATAYSPAPRTVGSGMTSSLLPTAIPRSSSSHCAAGTGYCNVPLVSWYLLLTMTLTLVLTLPNLPSPWVAWTSTEMAYLIPCHPISLTCSPLTFSCTPPLSSSPSVPSYALSSAGVILPLESGFFLPVLSPSTPSSCLPCGVVICLNTPSSHPLHNTLMVSPYPWCCD